MQKFRITILFILIWSFSFSQQYIHYNTANGLPSNHIYRITQDHQGFIWFITDKGMVKFNGTSFKTFTTKEGLPTNDIWDIRITPDDKVWYFSKADRLGYIFKDSVYAFPSANKKILFPVVINQNKNKIFFNNPMSFFELENKKWIEKTTTSKDIYIEKVFHKKIDYFVNEVDRISITVFDKNAKPLKKIELFNKKDEFKHRGQINDSLFVWIFKNKIKLLNLNTLKLYVKPIKYETHLTRFNAVNHQIQFSGENYVTTLDKNYHLSNYHFIPEKLHSHFSFVDKNKNLWIATFNNGIYFLPASKQQAKYQLINSKIGQFNRLNKQLFTKVHNKGFYRLDAVTNTFEPYIKINDYIYTATYIKELNTSYFLTDTKGYKIKNKVKTPFNNFRKARKLLFFKNKLYGFNSGALNLIDEHTNEIKKQYMQNGISDIIKFNNKIIIASSNGLKYFEKDSIQTVKKIKNFKRPVISIRKLNKNQLIVCTDGFGTYLTNLDSIKPLEKTEFLDVISARPNKNKIYLATNKGVWVYEKSNNEYELIKKYTINDGLLSNNINDVFIQGNYLFTSGNNGISTIPLNKKTSNQFLNIYFDEILYNNNPINNNANLPFTENSELRVKPNFIDFSESKKHTFSYQLLPIQKRWISSQSQQISFNNLPPNSYKLKIKSHDKVSVMNFKILPLWYQKIITKIIFGVLFLVFLISLILFIRKIELKKQEKKLQAQQKLAEYELHALRSQMNPHFVFNSLNAIQYYITKNNIELSEKYLVKFARLIRMFFDFSRQKEIPLSDEVKLLKGYLEIEKMRFGNDFNYKVEVIHSENIERFKIPTMLLQPIVENAVNHGIFHNEGKGIVKVTFNLISNSKLVVTISDNGVGIEKSKEIQKKSLHQQKKNSSTQVIKERIKLLNQYKKWFVTYKLINKEIGTTVQLTFIKNEEN